MKGMRYRVRIRPQIACILIALAFVRASEEASTNVSKVWVLTDDDFNEKTAEGFWLAEFYAPWCGHCKRLNPILDEISEEALVKHSMNIAKVDATVHKTIAESMKVKGFPTVKFRSSGDMEWTNYEGGRKAKDLLKFAERIDSPPLTPLKTNADLETFYNHTQEGGVGVGFITGGPSDLWTPLAKSMQAVAYFANIAPSASLASIGLDENAQEPFIAVVEKGETPRFFTGLDESDLLGLGDKAYLVKKWIQGNNAPLVNDLGPHNFRKLGKLGKLLVVGIVDPEASETPAFLRGLQTIARGLQKTGEEPDTYKGIQERYLFGHLDGVQWKDFVRQFNIYGGLPRVVVLDMPAEKFYEDPEVNEADEIDTFLKEVFVGKIPAQREGFKGSFGRLWRRIESMGWYSILLLVPVILIVLSFVISGEPKAEKVD